MHDAILCVAGQGVLPLFGLLSFVFEASKSLHRLLGQVRGLHVRVGTHLIICHTLLGRLLFWSDSSMLRLALMRMMAT
jgi:hypothetical protein